MKLTITRQTNFLPKTTKVTLSNVTSTHKIGQLKALAEALHLDFSATLGDQYISSDPHETELFRANFTFPIEKDPESLANVGIRYNRLKLILIMAFSDLKEEFLREEKKVEYLQYYDAVRADLEHYRIIGPQSLFYDQINVISLRSKASKLEEAIASLDKDESPIVPRMAPS